MTLQASASSGNPLTLNEIKTEFGGPDTFTSYRRGAGYVPNHQANASIPSTGTVSMLNFLSADKLFKPAITSGTTTQDLGIGTEYTEGYTAGSLGSTTYSTMGLSPSSLTTTTFLQLIYFETPAPPLGGSTVYGLNFKLSGNMPSWVSLVVNGNTFLPADVAFGGPLYDSGDNTTIWRWRGAAVQTLGFIGLNPSITVNIV